MSMVDIETAIATFLSFGRRLQVTGPLTGDQLLDELAAWYRESRIKGAALEEDADMLLLQWGATRLPLVSEPTDLHDTFMRLPILSVRVSSIRIVI